MELYHWYKGTELPDRECDCVVVYLDTEGPWDDEKQEIGHWYFENGEYVIAGTRGDEIPPDNIIAYLPIEFPKEVE